MRVFEKTASFKKDAKKPLVLALGNFDGIHLGHRRLLEYVVTESRKSRGRAAVFTFQQHPQHILHPGHVSENLQSHAQKIRFLKQLGIQICFAQKFDRKFSKYSAEKFVRDILVKKLGVREICLGYNARFGRGRQGDADLLREMGAEFGFKVFQAEPVLWRGSPVSSTAVREAVKNGKMDLAAGMLGRLWSIEGKVVRGEGRGRSIGYPTVNVDQGSFVAPVRGVYAAWVKIENVSKCYQAAVNVGIRPSFEEGGELKIEAHLLKFKKKIYGKSVEIYFVKKIRDEKKFASAAALKKQIAHDVRAVKTVLKKTGQP